MMKLVAKRQIDEIDKEGMKKVKVEEEMVCLDYLVLEQCVSLMKQKKFTNDLSLESVSKLFAITLHSNHRKLKVSIKSGDDDSNEFNLSHERWEGDLNLTMKNMTESQLKSLFKEIFIRFKRFHCVSFEGGSDWEQLDGPDILSQVIISDEEYRPIKMKQLKFAYIDKNISLINNLSSIVKEIHIRCGYACDDLCTAISTCTNLRSLVFGGEREDDINTPLRECVKLLKHLKRFQFCFEAPCCEKVDSKWLVTAFQDNTNLRSLSLCDRDAHVFDLASLCAPSMRSIMSRLLYLEISGGNLSYNPATDWTGVSEEVKQKVQQILSYIHVNGCMKVVCVIFNGNPFDNAFDDLCDDEIKAFTSMFTDIIGTYLEISNQAARQIDLFFEEDMDDIHKFFSKVTEYN